MNALRYIFIFLFCIGLLSSCAKDELESPAQSPNANSAMQSNSSQVEDSSTSEVFVPVSAAEVNDDGDDETAGPTKDDKKDK